MTRILVLEDQPIRVAWLKKVCAELPVEIFATDDVETFLVEAKKPHDVVIFDHDLTINQMCGVYRFAELTGADAAKRYDPPLKVPAVIWSINPVGAANIARALEDKDIEVHRLPFAHTNCDALAQALRVWVCDAAVNRDD